MNLDYPDSLSLICEALVREIRAARRWSTIEEAWTALLHVRQMARNMGQERFQGPRCPQCHEKPAADPPAPAGYYCSTCNIFWDERSKTPTDHVGRAQQQGTQPSAAPASQSARKLGADAEELAQLRHQKQQAESPMFSRRELLAKIEVLESKLARKPGADE